MAMKSITNSFCRHRHFGNWHIYECEFSLRRRSISLSNTVFTGTTDDYFYDQELSVLLSSTYRISKALPSFLGVWSLFYDYFPRYNHKKCVLSSSASGYLNGLLSPALSFLFQFLFFLFSQKMRVFHLPMQAFGMHIVGNVIKESGLKIFVPFGWDSGRDGQRLPTYWLIYLLVDYLQLYGMMQIVPGLEGCDCKQETQ